VVSRKYTKDYRIENVTLPGGKVVSRPVYCGKYYGFSADPRKLRRACACMTVSVAAYWLFFWTGLFLNSGAMRRWYVSLPYFCGFLPAAFLTSSLFYLWKYSLHPPRFGLTREQKDRLYDRISQCSFLLILLGALAAAGDVAYYLLGAQGYRGIEDIMVSVSVVAMTISAATIFVVKKHTKMQIVS
jgi:hypothetical protein